MKKWQIITLVLVSAVAMFCWMLFSDYRRVYDENVHLHSDYTAQNQVIEEVHGNMISTIQNKMHVTTEHADKIKEIFVPIIQGRYSQGDGTLMKWVQEQNPNFTPEMYKDVSECIEAKRNDFLEAQKVMTAIIQQHNNLRNEFWAHMFWLKNEPELQYTVISPSATKETMKTRVDDFDPTATEPKKK